MSTFLSPEIRRYEPSILTLGPYTVLLDNKKEVFLRCNDDIIYLHEHYEVFKEEYKDVMKRVEEKQEEKDIDAIFFAALKYNVPEALEFLISYLDQEDKDVYIAIVRSLRMFQILKDAGADYSRTYEDTLEDFSPELIEYSLDLNLSINKYILYDMLRYDKDLRVVRGLVAKGFKFDDLSYLYREIEDSRGEVTTDSMIYLIKLGLIEPRYIDMMVSGFLIVSPTDEGIKLVLSLDLDYNLDLETREAIIKLANHSEPYLCKFVYLNQHLFKKWPEALKRSKDVVTCLYIKEYILSL